MRDTRCGIVNESEIIFFPDDPIVEKYVARDLKRLCPEILYMDSDAVTMTRIGFDMLPEYSTSLPTGKADGKVWKCDTRSERGWIMREYVDNGDPSRWSIKDRKITVISVQGTEVKL